MRVFSGGLPQIYPKFVVNENKIKKVIRIFSGTLRNFFGEMDDIQIFWSNFLFFVISPEKPEMTTLIGCDSESNHGHSNLIFAFISSRNGKKNFFQRDDVPWVVT